MPTKKVKKPIKNNNLNFIATYLFEYPGSSATDVRRALWIYRNRKWIDIDQKGFSERTTYISYFHMAKGQSHRGYAGKFWVKRNRNSWILTADGLFRVRQKLIKRVKSINRKIIKQKMCRRG